MSPLSAVAAGQEVYIQVSFTTQDLPGNASYSIDYTVNGLTRGTPAINLGAGVPGTSFWHYRSFAFIASPGTNQVTVTLNRAQTVPETTYADNTANFAFDASSSPAGVLSYTVSQIRSAYGINLIPNYRGTPASGSGETIAIVDSYNAPNIFTDLDGFDQAMNLSSNSSPTLYEEFGPASSILTVYNGARTEHYRGYCRQRQREQGGAAGRPHGTVGSRGNRGRRAVRRHRSGCQD